MARSAGGGVGVRFTADVRREVFLNLADNGSL